MNTEEKLILGVMGSMVNESHRLRDSIVESTKSTWYHDGFEDGMQVGMERAQQAFRVALGIELKHRKPYWEIRDEMFAERRNEEDIKENNR